MWLKMHSSWESLFLARVGGTRADLRSPSPFQRAGSFARGAVRKFCTRSLGLLNSMGFLLHHNSLVDICPGPRIAAFERLSLHVHACANLAVNQLACLVLFSSKYP
jgi:hypothetical protein